MPRRGRNTLANMSDYSNIGTVGFQGVSFTPQVFEPKENDMTILARSIENAENRRNRAYEVYGNTSKAMAEANKFLSDDEETKAWFDSESKRITDAINQSIQLGDYGKAMRDASVLASDFLNSREYKDRMTSWAKYRQDSADVANMFQKGAIKRNTYDWWRENNKYQFDPTTGSYKDIELPVEDINWVEFASSASQLIQPDSTQTSKGHQFQYTKPGQTDADTTYNPRGTATKGGGYQSSGSRVQVTREEIQRNIDAIIDNIPDGQRRLRQDFKVNRWQYEKLVAQRDEMQRLVNEGKGDARALKDLQQQVAEEEKFWKANGSDVLDYKEYVANKLAQEVFSTNLAYIRTTSSFSDSDIFSVNEHVPSTPSRVNSQTGQTEYYDPVSQSWIAPKTQDSGGDIKLRSAQQAADEVGLYFEREQPQQQQSQ